MLVVKGYSHCHHGCCGAHYAHARCHKKQTSSSAEEVSVAKQFPLRHSTQQQQQQQQQRHQQQYNKQQYVSCACRICFLQVSHRCRQIGPADGCMSWFTCCRAWRAAATLVKVQSWLVTLIPGVMSSSPPFLLVVNGSQFGIPAPPSPPPPNAGIG